MNTIKQILLEEIENILTNEICWNELKKEAWSDEDVIFAQIKGVIEDVAMQNPCLDSVLDEPAEPTIINLVAY